MGVVSSSEATICLVDEQRVMESMDRHGVRALSPESLMWSVFRVGIGLKYFSFDGTIGTYIICGHIILYKMWLFKSKVDITFLITMKGCSNSIKIWGQGQGWSLNFSTRNSRVNLFSLELEIRNST